MNKELLIKFKEGRCSPEELRQVLAWYGSVDAEYTFSEDIERIWMESENHNKEEPFPEQEETYQKLKLKLGLPADENAKLKINLVKKKRRFLEGYFMQRAAAILLLFSVTGYLVYQLGSFIGWTGNDESKIAEVQWLKESTLRGQKLPVKLPDGTVLKLNSRSSIRYKDDFGVADREVWLEGEAWFQVASDSQRPFIIHCGELRTVVLGTVFNVMAYPEKESFEVVVSEGLVKVELGVKNDVPATEMLLRARESAVYHREGHKLSSAIFDIEKKLAWQKGIIEFENAGIEEIVKRLEDWYDVQIEVRRKDFSGKGYTGRFQNKSLDVVLEGISYVQGFDFELKNKKVVIK
ncbi:MAG: FecR domain-containing protein [Cyclobacteriaceae bacterium]|nr:FecR domain-containing protein [Cyclobacteriaceae bacterium]